MGSGRLQLRLMLLVAVLGFQIGPSRSFGRAYGQAPPASQDTVAHDSTESPRGASGHGLVALGFAAAFPVGFLAPAALPFIEKYPDTAGVGLPMWQKHLAVYTSVGGTARLPDRPGDRYGWRHSMTVEARWKSLYGQFQLDELHAPDEARYWSLRTGYFLRPQPQVAGGMTVGYRWANGDDVQDALLIGLPFVYAPRTPVTVWVEPVYVISSRGFTWTWDMRTEFHVPRSPAFAGLGLGLAPIRQGGSYHAVLRLLLGARW
jgi:hypothetical protein